MIHSNLDGYKFLGPLFIVGMGRSGTKLLRDLLNKNPKIGIPIIETGFIPYMIDHYGIQPGFGDIQLLRQFYQEFSHTNFYLDFARRGRFLSYQELVNFANLNYLATVFEFILKFYAPEGRGDEFVWGDKTPVYLNNMPLLKKVFPEAKFIHIFRDPRDYCLSVKKSWGKNMYRAAEDWRVKIQSSLIDTTQLIPDYMQVSYESLLDKTEVVLTSICKFIGVDFIPSMLSPLITTENLGAAKGQAIIVTENFGKYKNCLLPYQIKRIEEIVKPVARILDYEIKDDIIFKPVNSRMRHIFAIYDGFASIKYNISLYGFRQGLHRQIHWHSRGSWVANRFKEIKNSLFSSIK